MQIGRIRFKDRTPRNYQWSFFEPIQVIRLVALRKSMMSLFLEYPGKTQQNFGASVPIGGDAH